MKITKSVCLVILLLLSVTHCGNVVVGNGNCVNGDNNYINHGDGNSVKGSDNLLTQSFRNQIIGNMNQFFQTNRVQLRGNGYLFQQGKSASPETLRKDKSKDQGNKEREQKKDTVQTGSHICTEQQGGNIRYENNLKSEQNGS